MHYNFVRIHQSPRITPAMTAGVVNILSHLTDIVRVIEEWGAARSTKIGGETLVGQTGRTGMLERPQLPSDRARAQSYREKAEQFRRLAESEPIVHIREQLSALAEQYQQLADRLIQSN